VPVSEGCGLKAEGEERDGSKQKITSLLEKFYRSEMGVERRKRSKGGRWVIEERESKTRILKKKSGCQDEKESISRQKGRRGQIGGSRLFSLQFSSLAEKKGT